MSSADASVTRPRVLVVYYSYTHQSAKVADAMAELLRERGCGVHQAEIEFTDARYADRFTRFPLRHAIFDVVGMLPAQLRSATGEIRIPDAVSDGEYDLVCIGSPTWWLKTSVPIRSFLKCDAAGRLLDGTRFAAYVVCRRYWASICGRWRSSGPDAAADTPGACISRSPAARSGRCCRC